jgi:hypothetical protein
MKGAMADYYTNFSFVLQLKEPAQKEYALDIANIASTHRYEADQLPATFPQSLQDVLEDWHFEVEQCDEGVWFHSMEGGIDAVCAFVQHLLQKFEIPGHIAFEWSFDCSKPRADAFGGGAAVITATEIKTITTSEWLAAQTKAVAQT